MTITSAYPQAYASLAPLLAAEAAAEAGPVGLEAADLEQAVWLRLLESRRPPRDPAAWLGSAVREEADAARRAAARAQLVDPTDGRPAPCAQTRLLAAERRRALWAAVHRLPGRCPALVSALLSGSDPTYREISEELGISQGSLGPLRSRCLSCLRAALGSEVAGAELRGKEG